MPKDLDVKIKIYDKMKVHTENNSFTLSSMDLSNIPIKNVILLYNFNSTNFDNASLVNVLLWNILEGLSDNNSICNVKYIFHSSLREILFKDCEFRDTMISDSLFKDCEFINVKFNIAFHSTNIFENCTFKKCEEINFKKLKDDGVIFINSTIDGKKIS